MQMRLISTTATYYLHIIYFNILLFNICRCIDAFIIPSHLQNNIHHAHTKHRQQYYDAITTSYIPKQHQSSQSTSTSLNVWWFGGTPDASETSTSGEECELVAVRIDRTSANSRRIAGKFVYLEYCDLFLVHNSPWSALFRRNCGQCLTGRCLEYLN